jgi:hypothetical protein
LAFTFYQGRVLLALFGVLTAKGLLKLDVEAPVLTAAEVLLEFGKLVWINGFATFPSPPLPVWIAGVFEVARPLPKPRAVLDLNANWLLAAEEVVVTGTALGTYVADVEAPLAALAGCLLMTADKKGFGAAGVAFYTAAALLARNGLLPVVG